MGFMGNRSDTLSDTYELREQIGEGSGGIIYKAYHRRLEKEVVIKKLRSKSTDMQVNRQETDILKNLHHTYLPEVLDFIITDYDIYTVMSYIPGQSFKELIKEGYFFSQNELIRWGMQICSALNYLHNQNPPIIHGDIKPANIMLTPEGNICLIDFNIAFYLDDTTILGYTNGYTSPEQYIIALDNKSADSLPMYKRINEKSDIYSVGATFYHLATGEKLENYKDSPNEELLMQNYSDAFAKVILKAIQIVPERRFSTAFEMFKGFQGITKRDKRYQILIRRQRLAWCGLAVFLAGFILLGGYGIHTIRLETVEEYNELVKEQIEYRESRDYEKEENIYKEAVTVLPSSLESFYQHAYALYEQQDYRKCIDFIDYDILKNEKLDLLDSRIVDIYYIKADSLFRLGQYSESVEGYEEIFKCGGYNCDYYRDYAIALAYNGEHKKAQEILEDAINYGLKEDSIFYAKGEIEKSMNQWDNAMEEFQECIRITKEDTLKSRAYIMLSEIYNEQKDRDAERKVLLEAKKEIPISNQMLILERLAQVDIDLADLMGDSSYREEAIAIFEEIIEQGWDTYSTYDNLAILNEKQGCLDKTMQILEKMKEKYGIDYNYYKRCAFLEIDRQELKDNMDRDYESFAEYYRKAVQMYQEQLKDNDTDMEMELLDNVYMQVQSGGWLK